MADDKQPKKPLSWRNVRLLAALCLGVAFLGGLAPSAVLLLGDRGELHTTDWHTDWHQTYLAQRDWPMAFWHAQQAIGAARTLEQRARAGADMAQFLLDVDGPLPESRRQIMAREYVLAAMKLAESDDTRWDLWGSAMRIVKELDDVDLMRRTTKWREEVYPDAEQPFDALIAEWDARLQLRKPFPDLLEAGHLLIALAQDDYETGKANLRFARALTQLLDEPDLLAQVEEHAGITDHDTFRTTLLGYQEQTIQALKGHEVDHIRAEFCWLTAKKARQENDLDIEIDALYKAINVCERAMRTRAYPRLLEALLEAERYTEADELINVMFRTAGLTDQAFDALFMRLGAELTQPTLRDLLDLLEENLFRLTGRGHETNVMLLKAARLAMDAGWYDRAKRYLRHTDPVTHDRLLLAEILIFQAELARKLDDADGVLRYTEQFLNNFPTHPREADARFWRLEVVEQMPLADAHLVRGITAALIRNPRDERTLDSLFTLAQRMESHGLYPLAESYYQQAVLLSSLQHPTTSAPPQTTSALLGQARMQLRLNRDQEANELLRAIATSEHFPELRMDAGLLWATIALREGQHREAVRRWRLIAGPPNNPLLAHLFGVLVPDAGAVFVQRPMTPRMVAPPPPPEMVQAAAQAVMEQLLYERDFDGLDHLFQMIEADPVWKPLLPLEAYRLRALSHVAAESTPEELQDWLQRQGIGRHLEEPAAGLRSAAELAALLETVDDACRRLRGAVY